MAKKITMERKRIPLASLVENPQNPNMHPKEQIEDIAKSIREYGQYYPIIVDENNLILAGHGKKKALELNGDTEGECIVMRGLTDKQKKKLLLSDNKIQSFSFLNHSIEEDLIKEIDDTDIIGYNPEYISDLIRPVTYDNTGMEPQKPIAEYAEEARQMNTQPATEQPAGETAEPVEIPTDEHGQATEADDDNPMRSFTAKHTITCPHCGKPIEI